MVQAIDPLKSFGVEIRLPQAGLSQVKQVEVPDETLCCTMIRTAFEQAPIQLGVRVPLRPLPKFAAHEQQHLARKEPLEAEQRPQVGKLLPLIAWHPAQQRAFAMNDFIV